MLASPETFEASRWPKKYGNVPALIRLLREVERMILDPPFPADPFAP
jgi:hypothetical protein